MDPKDIAIAIVDDDEGVRTSLGFLLELHGFTVHQFESPAAFLSNLGDKTVDCLIIDQCMPETSGLTFAAQLCEIGVQLPIILITARFVPDTVEKAKALGIFRVLGKPFSEDVMPRLIMDAIADNRSRQRK